ncbi:MAG: AgmX/PglI C-terminal domain-containing protein [Myxococcales bacterium]|nr:AgmX/PglI C-terminal domain-containing protein [Myxococcales bacterium]
MDARIGNVVRLLQAGPYEERTLRRIRAALAGLRGHSELVAETPNLTVLLDDFAESSADPTTAAGAYLAAADLCEGAGQHDQLVERLVLAMGIDPRNTTAPRRLRKALNKPADTDRLTSLLALRAQTLAERDPMESNVTADAFSDLARARESAGDLDGAIEGYDRALDIEPSVGVVESLAALHARRRGEGDAEQAADLYCMLCDVVAPGAVETQLKRALSLVPGHAEATERLNALRAEAAAAGDTAVVEAPPELVAQSALSAAQAPESHGPVTTLGPGPGVPPTSEPPAHSSMIPPPAVAVPPPQGPSLDGSLGGSEHPSVPATPVPAPAGAATTGYSVPPAPLTPGQAGVAPTALEFAAETHGLEHPSAPPGGATEREAATVFQVDSEETGRKSSRTRSWIIGSVVALTAALATIGGYAAFSGQMEEGVSSSTLAATAEPAAEPAAPQDAPPVKPEPTEPTGAGPTPEATGALPNEDSPAAAAKQASPGADDEAQASPEAPAPSADAPAAPDSAPQAEADTTEDAPQTDEAEGAPQGGSGPQVRLIKNRLAVRGGDLKRASVIEGIDASMDTLQQCYQEALTRKPKMFGRLVYSVEVRHTGKPSRVKHLAGNIKDRKMRRCTGRALKSSHFEAFEKGKAKVKLALRYRQ